jgi:hypothetical protein
MRRIFPRGNGKTHWISDALGRSEKPHDFAQMSLRRWPGYSVLTLMIDQACLVKMRLLLGLWWSGLVCLFVILQNRGMAVDTYQAIWGVDATHPGNRGPAPKQGMRRPTQNKGEFDVW